MWKRKKFNIKLNCVNKRVPILCLFYFLDKRNTSLISENMFLGQYLQMHPQNYIHSRMCSSISYNDHSHFCTGLKPAVLCLGLCLLVRKYIYARKTFLGHIVEFTARVCVLTCKRKLKNISLSHENHRPVWPFSLMSPSNTLPLGTL